MIFDDGPIYYYLYFIADTIKIYMQIYHCTDRD